MLRVLVVKDSENVVRVDSVPDNLTAIYLINNKRLASVEVGDVADSVTTFVVANNSIESIGDLSTMANLQSVDLSGLQIFSLIWLIISFKMIQ